MADNEITFNVKLDNSQLEKELAKLKSQINDQEEDLKNTIKADADAIAALAAAEACLVKQREKEAEIAGELARQERERAAIVAQIEKSEAAIETARQRAKEMDEQWKSGVTGADALAGTEQAQADALIAEHGKLISAVQPYDDKIADATADLERQRAATAALVGQHTHAAIAAEQAAHAVSTAKIALAESKAQAGGIAQKLDQARQSGSRMGEGISRAKKLMNSFGKGVSNSLKKVFSFSFIKKGLLSFQQWMWKAIKTNSEATQAIGRLKGALLTMIQPVVAIAIPAFAALVNILARVATVVANVVSRIFGKTYEQSSESAKMLYGETEAIDGVGNAAKKASLQLAAFDEINQLSGDGGEAASGGNAKIKPIFGNGLNDIMQSEIDAISIYVSGALLAVGAILAFTGANVMLGIALMAAGAIGLVSILSQNWNEMDEKVNTALTTVLTTLGGFALVIGAILAFTGANLPLGIGLMLVGAAALGAAVALNWNAIKEALQGPIGAATAAVSAAFLALGAILAFTGVNLPLGIALMLAGAGGLVTVTVLNWEAIKEALQGPIGAVTAAVSVAFLALGAILAFTGVNVPLGIALMLAGAGGLATVTQLNWEAIKEALEGPIGAVTAAVSVAFLALGAVLAFTGVNLPLGIALMLAGAGALATVMTLNWDTIENALKGPIGAVTIAVSAALLVLGAILVFTGANLPLGIGMLITGGASLATAVTVNWDWLLDKLKETWRKIEDWWNSLISLDWAEKTGMGKLSGASRKFIAPTKAPTSFSSVSLPPIPMLASGSVIPPNRAFMAVLGDQRSGMNIEAPLVDGYQLGKATFNAYNRESRRIGVRLAEV
ncbi:MAG: hypothetical protein ABT01_00355 [Clostridium sp. SCN 57-10]|nr:MAG: hypothetical protein ABT01_00355 [Clostridium sp. SCN 57-10]